MLCIFGRRFSSQRFLVRLQGLRIPRQWNAREHKWLQTTWHRVCFIIDYKSIYFYRQFDDQALDFLNKIRPLFTNVFLNMASAYPENNMHLLLTYFLPMVGSIQGIRCSNECLEFSEQHFPGTMALAKELELAYPEPAAIPSYLDWLRAPQDFHMLGPRFLYVETNSETIFAIVDAVRQVGFINIFL